MSNNKSIKTNKRLFDDLNCDNSNKKNHNLVFKDYFEDMQSQRENTPLFSFNKSPDVLKNNNEHNTADENSNFLQKFKASGQGNNMALQGRLSF